MQGPPGTGKTRTLLALVCVFLATTSLPHARAAMGPLLACADTNAAADNLVQGLVARGVRVVRVGNPAKVSAGVGEYGVECVFWGKGGTGGPACAPVGRRMEEKWDGTSFVGKHVCRARKIGNGLVLSGTHRVWDVEKQVGAVQVGINPTSTSTQPARFLAPRMANPD
eukprot:scaffold206142_cov22-Tisochrysis_lutea.AAC.1